MALQWTQTFDYSKVLALQLCFYILLRQSFTYHSVSYSRPYLYSSRGVTGEIPPKKKKGIRLSDKFHNHFNLDVVLIKFSYVGTESPKQMASLTSHLNFFSDEGLIHMFHDLKHDQ